METIFRMGHMDIQQTDVWTEVIYMHTSSTAPHPHPQLPLPPKPHHLNGNGWGIKIFETMENFKKI